ncbi:hypothetical protein [Laspinema olomoucense]|uniref:hypothetical protein n=1 Tax=Laspinema olomoucense TaxID=3231600 RepID=UPI0021BB6869|nr:hypothetical protein [Laspinema sp. D3d]MCT7975220.1 hypothetical protein [Laspinema sp. D3d]
MFNPNKKLPIAITIGALTFAAYAWKAPDELHQAIPDSVIVISTLVQMNDKNDPPDDKDDDQNGSK